MKRVSIVTLVFTVLVLSLPLLLKGADAPVKVYDLTKTDMFVIPGNFNSENISVLGIKFDTPIEEVYQKFGLTESNITSQGSHRFLEIKPGFKLRLREGNKIESLLISKEFKSSLKGKTAKLFDSATSAKNFVTYITSVFKGTKEASPIKDGPFYNQNILYYAGFQFTLLGLKNEPDIFIEITFCIPGNYMNK